MDEKNRPLPADIPLEELSRTYLAALLKADQRAAQRMIMEAVDTGVPIKDIYMQVFQSSQYEVGRLWQTNQISVAQEHYCSAATQLIMAQLYPQVFGAKRNNRKLVATCVSGELHEIGIRMVSDFFEMEGWDTYYVGANAPAKSVLQAIEDNQAELLCISTTMYFHSGKTAEMISAVRASGVGRNVGILVGGYPFLQVPGLWEKVGADGFGRDAQEAVRVAENLVLQKGK